MQLSVQDFFLTAMIDVPVSVRSGRSKGIPNSCFSKGVVCHAVNPVDIGALNFNKTRMYSRALDTPDFFMYLFSFPENVATTDMRDAL
jgi:hypothetical protein